VSKLFELGTDQVSAQMKMKGNTLQNYKLKTFTKEVLTAFGSSYISNNVSYYELSKKKKVTFVPGLHATVRISAS
jgi:hypothetical protein